MSERPRRTPVPSQKAKDSTGAQRERGEAAPLATSGSFVALAHRSTPALSRAQKKIARTHTAQNRTTHVISQHLGNQSPSHHFERVLHCDISGRGCCVEHGRCTGRELRGGVGSDRFFLAHWRHTTARERAQNRTKQVSSQHLGNQSRSHHFECVLHCNISGCG